MFNINHELAKKYDRRVAAPSKVIIRPYSATGKAETSSEAMQLAKDVLDAYRGQVSSVITALRQQAQLGWSNNVVLTRSIYPIVDKTTGITVRYTMSNGQETILIAVGGYADEEGELGADVNPEEVDVPPKFICVSVQLSAQTDRVPDDAEFPLPTTCDTPTAEPPLGDFTGRAWINKSIITTGIDHTVRAYKMRDNTPWEEGTVGDFGTFTFELTTETYELSGLWATPDFGTGIGGIFLSGGETATDFPDLSDVLITPRAWVTGNTATLKTRANVYDGGTWCSIAGLLYSTTGPEVIHEQAVSITDEAYLDMTATVTQRNRFGTPIRTYESTRRWTYQVVALERDMPIVDNEMVEWSGSVGAFCLLRRFGSRPI